MTQPRNTPLARINNTGDLSGRIGGTRVAYQNAAGTLLTSADTATTLELAQGDMNEVWNFMRGRGPVPGAAPSYLSHNIFLAADCETKNATRRQTQCHPPPNKMTGGRRGGKMEKSNTAPSALARTSSMKHPDTAQEHRVPADRYLWAKSRTDSFLLTPNSGLAYTDF
ncbi:hypothetical protein C8R44DRAFT_748680 [Mycena epipterygia]|nr:hypothetical protein C8R44DRAFT_748680 [Mycena epipterygia]